MLQLDEDAGLIKQKKILEAAGLGQNCFFKAHTVIAHILLHTNTHTHTLSQRTSGCETQRDFTLRNVTMNIKK